MLPSDDPVIQKKDAKNMVMEFCADVQAYWQDSQLCELPTNLKVCFLRRLLHFQAV